jgi:hypothetical protein
MDKIKIPGFTAEKSLTATSVYYRATYGLNSKTVSLNVLPAMRNTCDVLATLLWGAYLQGSYTSAQFFYDAMKGAGCFR